MIESYKRYIYTAGFIFIIISGIFAGSQYMNVDLMEARNFVTAREMISNHDWLIPTMNGELRIAKPPLPTWATAFAMHLAHTDTNLMADRLPAGFAALLMVFFVYSLARSISKSRDVAIYSAIVLSTSYMFMYMARKGTWDIFAHSFMLGAIWLCHDALLNDIKSYGRCIMAGALMGLSWMSKGPVAFYALLIPFIVSQLTVYGAAVFRGKLKYLLVMLITCFAISSAWPVYLLLNAPADTHQVAANEAIAWFSRHIKPIWYYLQFPAMSGIWVFIALPMLWPQYAVKKISDTRNYKLMVVWMLVIIVLLSVIPEKKDRYLLPVTVPLSVIIAYYFRYLVNAFKREQLLRDDRIIIGIYLVLNILMSAMTVCAFVYEYMQAGFSDMFFVILAASIMSNISIYYSIRHKSGRSFVFSFVVSFILLLNVAPPIAQRVTGDKDFMMLIKMRPAVSSDEQLLYSPDDGMKTVWAIGHQIVKNSAEELAAMPAPFTALYLDKNSGADKIFEKKHIEYTKLSTAESPNHKTTWTLYKVTKK